LNNLVQPTLCSPTVEPTPDKDSGLNILGVFSFWQVVYGMALNLASLKRFGKTMWVHNTSGSKLNACVWEGRWIGFKIKLSSTRFYQPLGSTSLLLSTSMTSLWPQILAYGAY
jgi:hypothetical protein